MRSECEDCGEKAVMRVKHYWDGKWHYLCEGCYDPKGFYEYVKVSAKGEVMSCPYSEAELAKWDSVANPIGEACYHCYECECEHWTGSCEGCPKLEAGICENPDMAFDWSEK